MFRVFLEVSIFVRPSIRPSVRPSVRAVDGLCFVQRTCPRGLRFWTWNQFEMNEYILKLCTSYFLDVRLDRRSVWERSELRLFNRAGTNIRFNRVFVKFCSDFEYPVMKNIRRIYSEIQKLQYLQTIWRSSLSKTIKSLDIGRW